MTVEGACRSPEGTQTRSEQEKARTQEGCRKGKKKNYGLKILREDFNFCQRYVELMSNQ